MTIKPAAVCLRGVTKNFIAGNVVTQALRGVDLEVQAGEVMILVGPSGCGKTTLISIIAGILDQSSGESTVFGVDLHKANEEERTVFRGKRIGFVFQAFNLIPQLSVVENVTVPLLINGDSRRFATRKAADLLTALGLGAKLQSRPSDLSGGQMQRVAIARAMIHSPDLIVADEPTSALDEHTGQEVVALLRSEALKRNCALVVVTHDNRIFPYADRIAHMNDGVVERVVGSRG